MNFITIEIPISTKLSKSNADDFNRKEILSKNSHFVTRFYLIDNILYKGFEKQK